MNILITGATGFIGRHLVKKLFDENHRLIVVTRNRLNIEKFEWRDKVTILEIDLHFNYERILNNIELPDLVIHLAWSNLPNYNKIFHVSENLPADIKFLSYLAYNGIKRFIVTGTCYEYGLQEGCLLEDLDTAPITTYGFAKDTLRRYLEILSKETGLIIQWLRLFYIYGDGQNSNSIIGQLEFAIKNNQKEFNMTNGNQIRDYLPISEVVRRIQFLLLNPQINGVINCCSGVPISIYDFILRRRDELGSNILLNRGYYNHTEIAPFSFWGHSSKLSLFGNT